VLAAQVTEKDLDATRMKHITTFPSASTAEEGRKSYIRHPFSKSEIVREIGRLF
jgi:hypothetical protein